MKVLTRFQGELLKEYNRVRKRLRTRLKHSMAPVDVKVLIKESFTELTERQAKIIALYIYRLYKGGSAEAKKDLKGVMITAAAVIPDIGDVGFSLDEVSQQQMNRIFHNNLGAIGNYNEKLSKTLQTQYNKLLSDNRLIASLNREGWTPWLDETLKKRGTDLAVIDLIKGQKTSRQMINILELHGIKGGMHPNQVAKKLIPHVNRFFGPDGVVLDNIGKTVKRFRIDADGNYGWFDHKVTKVYKATPRTYSRLIARDTLRQARMDAYYDSLKGSKLVDHYISVAHMDSNTCAHCAMMHGQTVTKGAGPQYHGNCGCDLRPVWKSDSPLASQNKQDTFYEKQRNTHFMRTKDLKDYNAQMPRGMKLKYATQLPEDAITKVIPDKAAMRKIRHEMLGKPVAIKPSKLVTKPEVQTLSAMNDKEIANELWKKTVKDGKEHAVIRNGIPKLYKGGEGRVVIKKYPKTPFELHHTHPSWDAPLSGADLEAFLGTENMKVMIAITNKNIYKVTRTSDTPSQVGYVKLFFKTKMDQVFRELCTKHKISAPNNSALCNSLWKDAAIEANKEIAKIAKYKFEVIPR